ncbi:MAG TPA: ATP-binding protein [Bacillota bacterium]|nr:ATP-binding protein [Bacillota bacterium]
MNRVYKADLHIHSALSPCAEQEMTPPKIIHGAKARGLSIIAITDHNSAANTGAVVEAAKGSNILVIPGLEVQTREEVHLVCLFATVAEAVSLEEYLCQHSVQQQNNIKFFGSQSLMDNKGRITGEEIRLLIAPVNLTVEQVVTEVRARGGICIPAHVDRPSFSLLASLGFIPPELEIGCVEVSRHCYQDEAQFLFPGLKNLTLIGSSDAHALSELGTQYSLISIPEAPSFQELKLALEGKLGRKVLPRMKEIALHIIDIAQNSIEAGATQVGIKIEENLTDDYLALEITDNGRGMSQDMIERVTDPFFTTRNTRRIGLGLPLLKAAAERCEGRLELTSVPGEGTKVVVRFKRSHIDRAPLGNMVDTIVNMVVGYPDLDLHFVHRIDDREILFDSGELRRELEDVPLNNLAVVNWIRNFLAEAYADLNSPI